VKQLTTDVSAVVRALLLSSVLEVDSTRTLLRNFQVEEMPEYAETLPRTVCVENLRASATIETVEGMMKPLGHPVCYVQIPTVCLPRAVLTRRLTVPLLGNERVRGEREREREGGREGTHIFRSTSTHVLLS